MLKNSAGEGGFTHKRNQFKALDDFKSSLRAVVYNCGSAGVPVYDTSAGSRGYKGAVRSIMAQGSRGAVPVLRLPADCILC